MRLAVPVTLLVELSDKLHEGSLTTTGTKREGSHHVDIGGAVQFTCIEHQPLVVGIEFEGVGHVWLAEELTGIVQHVGLARGQQFFDEYTILRLIMTARHLSCGRKACHDGHEE